MQILPTLAGFQRKRELQKEKKFQNKDIFLVIKGTDLNSINEFRKDGYSDIQMGLRMLPDQMPGAEKSYIRLVQTYGKDHVIVSGHSLGGSEAQIIGAKYGAETITFTLQFPLRKQYSIVFFGRVQNPT